MAEELDQITRFLRVIDLLKSNVGEHRIFAPALQEIQEYFENERDTVEKAMIK